MNTIKSIPNKQGVAGNYWTQTDSCAGFTVSAECPWRFEEMQLISFTPKECNNKLGKKGDANSPACEDLRSYMRIQNKYEKRDEAKFQFSTTLFTCFVLTIASLNVSGNIEIIVIFPIKKIVDII
jgi:hypothetical protein